MPNCANPSDAAPSALAESRRLLRVLSLPSSLRTAVMRALEEAAAARAAVHRAAERSLGAGWRLMGDGAGGYLLLENRTADSVPCPWACFDRFGRSHLLAEWSVPGLRWAWLRLPAGQWLELRPRTESHPLWGISDALYHHRHVPDDAAPRAVGLLPALDYARLRWLPPLDTPASLPPGAGSAVLNFLARLMTLQGVGETAYRGPYPTAALFATLCGSFVPLGPSSEAQGRFTRGEYELASRGEMAENPQRWQPAPFAAALPRPRLMVHLRGGVETAWVDDVPFRRTPTGSGALAAGERVWREDTGRQEQYSVGLVLLGRPQRRIFLLNARGEVLDEALPAAGGQEPWAALVPMAAPWRAVVFAWSALRATPALAPAILALGDRIGLCWVPLPLALARAWGEEVWVNASLASEYRKRHKEEDDAALALMLVSDVLEGAGPCLRGMAQQQLEAARPSAPVCPATGGAQAQDQARTALRSALPKLVAALRRGEALPEDHAPDERIQPASS